jgi:hypothetical protein
MRQHFLCFAAKQNSPNASLPVGRHQDEITPPLSSLLDDNLIRGLFFLKNDLTVSSSFFGSFLNRFQVKCRGYPALPGGLLQRWRANSHVVKIVGSLGITLRLVTLALMLLANRIPCSIALSDNSEPSVGSRMCLNMDASIGFKTIHQEMTLRRVPVRGSSKNSCGKFPAQGLRFVLNGSDDVGGPLNGFHATLQCL